MEARDPKSAESSGAGQSEESKDAKSDATSSDTLSDVEQSEKVPSSGGSESSEGKPSSVPSPDGAFDEGRSGQDGITDPGPM